MKAITIHQPWASLIAIGAKKFETRGWKTNYRGPIAIHASKKSLLLTLRSLRVGVQDIILSTFYAKYNISSRAIDRMPTGVIVATANLSECYEVLRTTGEIVLIAGGIPKVWIGKDSPEANFGYFEDGRYAWELTDVKTLDKPIPAKGQQGLWNWEGEVNP